MVGTQEYESIWRSQQGDEITQANPHGEVVLTAIPLWHIGLRRHYRAPGQVQSRRPIYLRRAAMLEHVESKKNRLLNESFYGHIRW